MKKIFALVLVLAMVFALVSCNNTKNDDVVVRVAALNGPTGMGMVQVIENDSTGVSKNDYEFTLASNPTEISAAVIAGTVDIAAVPVNLAATLFNKPDVDISFAAINTLGVLYILENGNTVNSLSDLNGKKIYATGQGSTPQYILEYLLEKNGIEVAEIEYIAEHAELATKLASNDAAIGLLPEPQVTVAMNTAAKNGNTGLRVAVDVTAEWEKLGEGQLVQGCIIVSNTFKEEHPEQFEAIMEEYKAAAAFVAASPKEASQLIAKHGIVAQAALAEKAIPNCNICCIDGEDGISYMKNILEVLYTANPKSVGGALPADEFYGK